MKWKVTRSYFIDGGQGRPHEYVIFELSLENSEGASYGNIWGFPGSGNIYSKAPRIGHNWVCPEREKVVGHGWNTESKEERGVDGIGGNQITYDILGPRWNMTEFITVLPMGSLWSRKELNFIEHLLYSYYCSKHFTLFIQPSQITCEVYIIMPILQMGQVPFRDMKWLSKVNN